MKLHYLLLIFVLPLSARGENMGSMSEDGGPKTVEERQAQDEEEIKEEYLDKLKEASSRRVRQFHEVLDQLLSEFSYDLKVGVLNKFPHVAFRKVTVSEALPRTYREYLRMIVAERMDLHSPVKVINCIPCETKVSKIENHKVIVTAPNNNLPQLQVTAKQLGINHFIDVVLIYHTTHMVLGFKIFDIQTNELVWTRTYNSETIRSRYQRLAVDFSQIRSARESDGEYQPDYHFLLGLGGGAIPNIGGTESDSAMLAIEMRGTERFNARRQEFGLMLTIFMNLAQAAGGAAEDVPKVEGDNLIEPFKQAIALSAIFTNNMIGPVESYDRIRVGWNIAPGLMLAPSSSYFAGLVRLGVDTYFGRRFVISTGGFYIMPSTILVDNTEVATAGGIGGALAIAYNF